MNEQRKHTPGPWSKRKAKQRLIAAAPELLDALIAAMKCGGFPLEIANQAAKAIGNATGGSVVPVVIVGDGNTDW